MDKKKYIRELFEVVDAHSILFINMDNQLIRLNVPFTVLVVLEVTGLYPGEIAQVTAIKVDIKLIDIYPNSHSFLVIPKYWALCAV